MIVFSSGGPFLWSTSLIKSLLLAIFSCLNETFPEFLFDKLFIKILKSPNFALSSFPQMSARFKILCWGSNWSSMFREGNVMAISSHYNKNVITFLSLKIISRFFRNFQDWLIIVISSWRILRWVRISARSNTAIITFFISSPIFSRINNYNFILINFILINLICIPRMF